MKLPASPIKTVYIVPFSHYDLGFVEPPEAVKDRAARHIDEVIRVAESDSNFKWTIESVWQVNEWLKRQRKPTSVLPKDREKIRRLMDLIKSGRVAISSAWGSMHTDFMGGEELNRFLYDYTALRKTYGITSEFAMMNDVPGHPTSIPSVLAGSGMRYMVTGANTFIGNATDIAPGKVPFYWQSPDGSKVLTWISQGNRGGYVEAVTEFYLDPFSHDPYTDRRPFEMFNPDMIGKTTPIQEMELGMTRLLERYNAAGYKYDAAMALYSHDFVEPTGVANLQKALALWKQHHPEIELKIATPVEFFKYIESKYAAAIPTFKGEWSGLWSEAKTQSPQISAMARRVQDNAPAAETLWSAIAMTKGIAAPSGNVTAIYDLILTYDEHSGAGNNGWPQLNSRKPLEDQNRQYVDYMKRANGELDLLFDRGIAAITARHMHDATAAQLRSEDRSLIVYNGLSWPRTDVVRFKAPQKGLVVTAVSEGSNDPAIQVDLDDDGNYFFIAKDIPAFGYRTYRLIVKEGTANVTLKPVQGSSAANEMFSVEMGPDGSVKSIKEKASGRELVNNAGELPFNRLLRVEGSDASVVTFPVAPKVNIKQGSVVTEIEVIRERSPFPRSTIRLYKGVDRVDLQNELDRSRFPFVGGNENWSDAYYFAFPFNVPKDGMKVVRGGQKWFDMLPDDYLSGARKDSVTTRGLIGFTNSGATALVAHRQAFHWAFPSYVSTKPRAKGAPKEFPAMFMGKFPLPEATIYSRAVRHSDQADTHDAGIINVDTVEPGLGDTLLFDYAFSSGGAFDAVAAWRLANSFNVPLRAMYIETPPVEESRGYFTIDQPNVQLVTVKTRAENVIRGEVSSAPLNPKLNKHFVARLQEFAGKAAVVKLTVPGKVKSAAIVSLTEDKVLGSVDSVSPITVSIKPYQTLTIAFEIE